MKIVIILIFSITIISCSSSTKVTSIKLDGSNKIIFRDGDVIYFTNIDSSGISFHYTDDEAIKTKEAKNILLKDFVIEYDSRNADKYFEPFTKQKKDSILTPKNYISEKYNKFANILEGNKWGTLTKYKHKKLTVKKIDWDVLDNLVVNEIYYRQNDSLQIEIPIPKDIANFCNEFKSKYPDAKYILLFRNVYVTYNIFEGRKAKVSSHWIGTPGNANYVPGYEIELDDALFIAPKIVIDINQGRLLSVDVQNKPIDDWDNFIWDINWIIEEEAEFYNLRF